MPNDVNGSKPKSGPKQIAGFASRIIDPLLARRVGLTTALMSAWPDIVGDDLSKQSRPVKIKWPPSAADGEFQPGTLIVAAQSMAALHLQHETGEILARVNGFMGYTAVTAVKIEQRQSVSPRRSVKRPQPRLTQTEMKRLDGVVASVENDRLRDALRKMGESILKEKQR